MTVETPLRPSACAKLCVLDLDHTVLHMLKAHEFPAGAANGTEDVVSFAQNNRVPLKLKNIEIAHSNSN